MLAENLIVLRNIKEMLQEQIVIPKAARDIFNLQSGDRLIVLGDEKEGIALVKAEEFEERMRESLRLSQQPAENK